MCYQRSWLFPLEQRSANVGPGWQSLGARGAPRAAAIGLRRQKELFRGLCGQAVGAQLRADAPDLAAIAGLPRPGRLQGAACAAVTPTTLPPDELRALFETTNAVPNTPPSWNKAPT